ncbi:hypothetical protein BsWGS_22055 [Bradybaena similaris]
MAPVNIKYIVSFSSQDDCHKAVNLVTSNGSKVWLSDRKDTSGKSEVILQLEKPTQLAYLDIGAVWCATLEVRVGRSDWPQTMEFKPLIPTFMLMSPLDCRLSRGFKSTQMFSRKDFSQGVACELWDRLHIICRQPHRRDVQLGLSFIHIRDASTAVLPGSSSVPATGSSPLGKSAIGVSLSGKSAVDASIIQKHFFGDVNKPGDSPTDRLKYRLMKMAGSTGDGCEQEQALSRTAQLVLKASENQKPYSPWQTSSPLPRKGLFSEHVAKKNDVPVTEEMKSFLQTLNVTVADIDTVTIADLRHKLERKKRRKLTKEERHTFSEICQHFFYHLFDKNSQKVESGKPGSVLGSKVQSDLPETSTNLDKLSKQPVKAGPKGKTQTSNRNRTSLANQRKHVRSKDVAALSPKAEKDCYGKQKSAMLNAFPNQGGWIKSTAFGTSVEEKPVTNQSRTKILPLLVSPSVSDGQVFNGEKQKENMHHLSTAGSRDLISQQQKLSLKTSLSSPCQNLHPHREKQTVSKGDAISHGEADSDSSSSLSYDSDSESDHESEVLSPCPSPKIMTTKDIGSIVITEDISNIVTSEDVRNIVTTKDISNIVTSEDISESCENVSSHAGQDKTPISSSSIKPAKLKRLSKASFDIFQEFSMEIMNDDDESICKADDRKFDISARKRESFQSESKNVSSQLDSYFVNDADININSGNDTPQKMKSYTNGDELIKSYTNGDKLMKKTPTSAKGRIYRMRTSRNKLNVSQTKNNSNLQNTYKVSETPADAYDVDRLDTLVNQNCPEYLSDCNKSKYMTSPDKISRRQVGIVRASELCAPSCHDTAGSKRTKMAADWHVTVPFPSSRSNDRPRQRSRAGQESKEHFNRRRTGSIPPTVLQDTAFCENCYGEFPVDVIPAHRAFCAPVRLGTAAGTLVSPDELLIDETVDCGECPICLQRFPQDVLLVHASDCGV